MPSPTTSTPVVLSGDIASPLVRLRAHDLSKDEDWLQALLFRTPSLLPSGEIDPVFGPPAAVARELPTPSGSYIDLLLVDSAGHLTIVETKLWRNPEARRKVVAQIIDYASELALLSYDELRDLTRLATDSDSDDPILSAARAAAGGDLDENDFREAVSRNLTHGRFLLMIVGDDTHDAVGRMAEFFQTSPQRGFTMNFTVAVVELALYRLGPGGDSPILVQPRVMSRTREVTRAVVEIRSASPARAVEIAPPVALPPVEPVRPKPATVRGQEFFDRLAGATSAEVAALAAAALADAPRHELEVEWGGNGPLLKFWPDGKTFLNFGQITPDGTLSSSGWLSAKCNRLGLPEEVWRPYYATVAALLGNARIEEDREDGVEGASQFFAAADGDEPALEPLLRSRDEWFAAIDETVVRIRDSLAARATR